MFRTRIFWAFSILAVVSIIQGVLGWSVLKVANQNVCTRDIVYILFLRHRLHPWTKGVIDGLNSTRIQIKVPQVVIHKAD